MKKTVEETQIVKKILIFCDKCEKDVTTKRRFKCQICEKTLCEECGEFNHHVRDEGDRLRQNAHFTICKECSERHNLSPMFDRLSDIENTISILKSGVGIIEYAVSDYGDYTFTSEIWNGDVVKSNSITVSVEEEDDDPLEVLLANLDYICENANVFAKHERAFNNKMAEIYSKINEGLYQEAYDKLLKDITPKLTGFKVDQLLNTWGNGIFKNVWSLPNEEITTKLYESLTILSLL